MNLGSTSEEALQYGEWLLESRNLTRAVAALNCAELRGAPKDECSSGRWLAAMLRGDFAAAWSESDAIRARGAADPNRFWQGEEIRGKRVMLRCLHGFGDAVQFLRFAPMLQARASRLIVEVPPAMLELARRFEGLDSVITWGEQAPAIPPSWDVQVEVIELPYLFRIGLEDLPIATNYLHLPPWVLRDTAPRPRSSDHLQVGIVWTCGEWNLARSVPIELLRHLVRTPGCEFWNLQGGPSRPQWGRLGSNSALHDVWSSCDSIMKLAGLVAQLDLVITPDTLTAHLAGALGTPAWVMLEHASDWRWMHARTDSPWYPSLRLFRQPSPGDWGSVIQNLQSALMSLASSDEEWLVA